MRATALPASPSRNVFTIGMAPPTAASKLSATLCFSASAASSTPCSREQRLVGGDHGLAGLERALDRRLRRIAVAADQLDEHIDARIGRKRDRVRDPAQLLQVDAAILAARARADRDDLDRPAARGASAARCCVDQAHHRGADRAETGKTHFQGRRAMTASD